MERHPNAHYRVIVATLVGAVAVPMTSTALFLHEAAAPDANTVDLRQTIRDDQVRLRSQRRAYWRAIEQYQRARKAGIEINRPNFNEMTEGSQSTAEPSATEPDPEVTTPEQPAKPAAPSVTSLTTNELTMQDRHLLRRYTRANVCPEGLKDFRVAGFWELCMRLVGENVSAEPVRGLLNHSAYIQRTIHSSAPNIPAFKLRMQMMDQALNGRRRDPGVLPNRPDTCVFNPNCNR